jgi:LacI family transcriptional regulator
MLKGFKHPFFSDILNNFRKVIEDAGLRLLFLSRTLGSRQMSYVDHCDYRNVDGVLIMNIQCREIPRSPVSSHPVLVHAFPPMNRSRVFVRS